MAAVSGGRSHTQNSSNSIDFNFSDDTNAHLFLTSGRILSAICYGGDSFLVSVKLESSDPEIIRVANEAIERRQWKVLDFLITHRFEAIEKSPDYKKIADAFAANRDMAISSCDRIDYTPSR